MQAEGDVSSVDTGKIGVVGWSDGSMVLSDGRAALISGVIASIGKEPPKVILIEIVETITQYEVKKQVILGEWFGIKGYKLTLHNRKNADR